MLEQELQDIVNSTTQFDRFTDLLPSFYSLFDDVSVAGEVVSIPDIKVLKLQYELVKVPC